MGKKLNIFSVIALSTIFLSNSASALNIILSNDDSWKTANIQTLFTKLKTAGHDVIMSAPCTGQSGKGGAINFLKEVPVDVSKAADNMYCVGQTDSSLAFGKYIEGTPVMSVMYGLDVLAKAKWGRAPDLVISGPNEGHNLGHLTNTSGTLGNANFAIARGIPAIAVSASHKDTGVEHAGLVADVVLNIVTELVKNQKHGEPLLPLFTGLNINTPENMKDHAGYLFTKVGWNPGEFTAKFVSDMSTEQYSMEYIAQRLIDGHPKFSKTSLADATTVATAKSKGKSGVVITNEILVPDTNEKSEGVAILKNYITISTIDGSLQATKDKESLTHLKLKALMK